MLTQHEQQELRAMLDEMHEKILQMKEKTQLQIEDFNKLPEGMMDEKQRKEQKKLCLSHSSNGQNTN